VEAWLAGLRARRRPAWSGAADDIPKMGGREGSLGIPTIRGRVVQTAAKIVLEPIFEADF
jgi:RNA-directed DNA polymerase